jgi:hypothetical protein
MIHKLINSIWNEEKLPEEWKELIILPTYKKGKKQIVVIIEAYHFCQLLTNLYPTSLLSRLTPYAEEIIGYHQCGFWCKRSTTAHIFCILQIPEKKWDHNEAVRQLLIDFKKASDSVRREILCNILLSFISL